MKRNHLLTALAAIGMMAACQKTGPATQSGTDSGIIDDSKPAAVQFGLGAVGLESGFTKSSGVVGGVVGESEENKWNGQELYIYGIEHSDAPDYSGELFIDNVKAIAPKDAVDGVLQVTKDGTEDGDLFYYSGNKVYDFYGYYVDDATMETDAPAVPTKETDRIYVPFTITGGQDIMLATTDKAEDVKSSTDQNLNENTLDRVYSAYAARRGVHPNLVFEHQLARFTFEIVAGSEEAANIVVDDVKVISKNKGTLEIVGANRGVTFENGTAELALMELDGTTNTLVELKDVSPDAFVEEVSARVPKKIGESIMVAPGEASYDMTLTMHQNGVTENIKPQEYVLDAKKLDVPVEKFEAGKSYKIILVIYGLEDVEIKATLEAWEDGGSGTIDPDKWE